MPELKTIAPRKWQGNYGGNAPALDVDDGVAIGDIAVDVSVTPYALWLCRKNTAGAPAWTKLRGVNVVATTLPYIFNINDGIILLDTSAAGAVVEILLPEITNANKHIPVTIKWVHGAEAVQLKAFAGNFIDGADEYDLAALYDFVTLVPAGDTWHVIAKS